ncbi:hypothetical protein QTP88_025438 [Uroleucon formosanum]
MSISSKTIDEPQLIPNKVQITSEKISEYQDQIESMPHLNDIGIFVNRDLTNDEKYCALTKVWVPLPTYKFPLCIKNEKRGLKFQYHWLLEFNWLVFRKHSTCDYHVTSVVKSDQFLDIFTKKQPSIIEAICVDRNVQIQENRKKLVPIIECIILCGRQEIALRGHNDSGKMCVNGNIFDLYNDGNFRAILRYRGKGDNFLKLHLENSQRYKYIGAKIQNEIIAACGDIIQKKIVEKINAAECFSILADETTDVSNKEQLTLCVRYIDDQNNLCEDFLKYVNIDSLTGASLSSAILNGLTSCGVQCDFLFGQGHDGASNMSGKFRGVQAIICEKYPQALYVHCAAHSLNLAVSSASSIPPIRNCLGILCIHFLTLRNVAVWVQRYDAVNDFVELFPFVVAALEIISEWNDSSATDASILLKAIDSEFLISLQVIKNLFSYGLPLCKQLQSEQIDLMEAVCLAENTVLALKDLRTDTDEEFKQIFLKAEKLAAIVNINLSVKRIAKRQTNRANPFTDSMNNTTCEMAIEFYYRTTIFVPYVDHFIAQLEARFLAHKNIFKGFEAIFSKNQYLNAFEVESFQNLLEFYSPNVNKHNSLAELKIWRTKLLQKQIVIKTALDALRVCCPNLYPNINKLLKILTTLPVSTSTPERSFSTLKRVKTYLRNSMTEDRLNGLTMLAIHKDVIVTPDEVLDEMAKKPRKLDILI